MSTYTVKINWKNDSAEAFVKNRYSRGHVWEFDGGVTVQASSSPHAVRVPYSVEAAVDPEEALVAAASSCHMLTFLYLAAKAGFQVDSYTDNAVGEMTTDADGKQWIGRINLDPIIEWSGESMPSPAQIAELHHDAHEQCYIANSIKADVGIRK